MNQVENENVSVITCGGRDYTHRYTHRVVHSAKTFRDLIENN